MIRIRLKRLGRKKQPFYRIIVINAKARRQGEPIQELGTYNPRTKDLNLNKEAALEWIKKGASPSETVAKLIELSNEEGKLPAEVIQARLERKAKLKEAKKAKEEAAKKAAESEESAA